MLISTCLLLFFDPLSYTDFLNGLLHQIMCFSLTHLLVQSIWYYFL